MQFCTLKAKLQSITASDSFPSLYSCKQSRHARKECAEEIVAYQSHFESGLPKTVQFLLEIRYKVSATKIQGLSNQDT